MGRVALTLYRNQKTEFGDAVGHIQAGGCIVASLDEPPSPGGRVFLWVFHRDGAHVVFQNRLRFFDDGEPRFSLLNPGACVGPYRSVTEEGQKISEWRVPFAGLEGDVRVVA